MAGSAQVFLAETPKTDGHAGTIKVGTNSVESQESHSVQASCRSGNLLQEVLQAPLWPRVSRIVLGRETRKDRIG